MSVIIRTLKPEQYYLLEKISKDAGIEVPSPDFSWIEAAIEEDTGEVVGVVVTQMLVHTEPIWIKREYQGKGIKEQLMDATEGRLDATALRIGKGINVYNQPTNAAAERICRLRGYEKSERPLYMKIYTGMKLAKILSGEE